MADAKKKQKPIWYLAGPFHRYQGGSDAVKLAAMRAGAVVVDARHVPADKRHNAVANPPTIKLKPEFDPELAAKAKAEAQELAEANAKELAEHNAKELADAISAKKAAEDKAAKAEAELAKLKKAQAKADSK